MSNKEYLKRLEKNPNYFKEYYKKHSKQNYKNHKKWLKKYLKENPNYYHNQWIKRKEKLNNNPNYKKHYEKIHTTAVKKWIEKNPNKNRKIHTKLHKRWRHQNSDKMKIINHRKNAKRRNLDSKLLYPNIIDELSDEHHINNKYTIYIPKNLHRLYHHTNTNIHREMLIPIIKQLYPKIKI